MPSPFEVLRSTAAFKDLMKDWDEVEEQANREFRSALRGATTTEAASKAIYASGLVDGIERLRACLNRRLRREVKQRRRP